MIYTRSMLVLAVLGTVFVHNASFAARLVVPFVPPKKEGEAEVVKVGVPPKNDTTSTFTFPVKAHAFDAHYDPSARKAHTEGNIEIFYVGASQEIPGNEFALANAGPYGSFIPLAPTILKVDSVMSTTAMPNPLTGACIEHMTLAYRSMMPVVTTTKEPATIYHLNTQTATLTTCTQIHDAQGETTSGIVGLCSGQSGYMNNGLLTIWKQEQLRQQLKREREGQEQQPEQEKSEEKLTQENKTQEEKDKEEQKKAQEIVRNYDNGIFNYIVAAVKKKDGNFGDKGGGIALIGYFGDFLDKLDASTGKTKENRAAPFDGSHPAIKIGNDATITPNIIDMAFENALQRVYMVIDVTANSGPEDGARALVMGSIIGGKLTFVPIAPDTVFNDNKHIVGGRGADSKISLYKVRTLETSSRLHYVVVAGGNETSGNTIFALPLVNSSPVAHNETILRPEHGTLANISSTPVDVFFMSQLPNLKYRGIVTAALKPEDAYTMDSPAAMVGRGPLPLDPTQKITDMYAMNDAVYVSIGDEPSATCRPGVYCSQAILDNYGRISGWTPWHRAAGTQEKVFGIAVSNFSDSVWMLQQGKENVDAVKITQWSDGAQNGMLGGSLTDTNVGLAYQTSQILTPDLGGVHNVFMFEPHTPSFGQDGTVPGNQISLMIATGLGKVMLAETGSSTQPSIFTAHTGDFATDKQEFLDGSLRGFNNALQTKIMAISGGYLSVIGAITAAEVSRAPLNGNSKQGYLFVGGSRGLAVLCEDDMTGWDTSAATGGLHAHFNGLTPAMSFKPLGSYEHVRKLWSDAHYLYVLTRNRLDRITLKSIATASLEVVTVATPQALGLPEYTYFSDFGISDKLGVIATSSGLFRVGDCCDITEPSLISAHALNWTKVVMPESDAPVFRLLFISPTHDEGGFAYDGMMYVLSGSVTHNQTRVSRFFVSDVRNQPITDSTIQPLNDLFVKGTLSYLLEFGELKNYIATDGLAILNSHSGNQKCGAVLKAFSGESTSGTGFKTCSRYATPHSNFTVVKEFPLSKSTPKHSTIHRIVRSISGSWIVCGDFGLQMNE